MTTCIVCDAGYPLIDGVPVLISRNSVFAGDSGRRGQPTETERAGLRRFIPSITLNDGAGDRYGDLRDLIVGERGGDKSVVLIIGAGEGGDGVSQLAHDSIEVIRSDVTIGPNTSVCVDAHEIPFRDGFFDAIVVQAVLEHVLDPPKCVAEMHRVLRPRGLIYAETPFMQQVHMGAHDFTRYTALGHRRLFQRFETVSEGVAAGAGTALAWSLVYFMTSFTRGPLSRQVVNAIGRLMFFWLKYFDRLTQHNTAAYDSASAFYFLGRAATQNVTDEELLAGYSGAIGSRRRALSRR